MAGEGLSGWRRFPPWRLGNVSKLRLQRKTDRPEGLSVHFCSGGRIRTSDLRVMSPTSYQLLYPAVFGTAKVEIKTKIPKILFQNVGEIVEQVFFGNALLLAGSHILHGELALCHLTLAGYYNHRDIAAVGILELLLEL